MKRLLRVCLCAVFPLFVVALMPYPASSEEPAVTIAVMDPLALPLSCDCVEGHAQRRYEKLAAFLEVELAREVNVAFSEDLGRVLRTAKGGKVGLIIGKQSVVKYDAAEYKLPVRPIAMLTGLDGDTTLTGLFVVPTADRATTLADLKGYTILFGPKDSAEKHSAALAALVKAGVPPPKKIEFRTGCSDAAVDILEEEFKNGAAAVISSYAKPLLEGCGTIDKGSLRVIGRTEPVPFVTVFATPSVSPKLEKRVLAALLEFGEDPKLRKALETKIGFVPITDEKGEGKKGKGEEGKKRVGPKKPEKKTANRPAAAESSANDWPGWRGPNRDGISPLLPKSLPKKPKFVWRKRMTGEALSGIAVAGRHVIVADRDPNDASDIFRCLDASTGKELWKLQYAAAGDMDYGNSPRATPLIHDGRVYLLGAFGDLHCLRLADGRIEWKTNLVRQFSAKSLTWGMCSSPLIVDDKLIVNPGAKEASLAALDRITGKVVWQSPGLAGAYSSFIVGTFGGVRQIVGYDAVSLGGWDVESGRRLWKLFPDLEGDFNVPTPVQVGGRLLVTTENNGTRLYNFDKSGNLIPKPVALNEDLAPDTSTPVVIGEKVFGGWVDLFCLDLNDGLKPVWTAEDEVFEDYVSLIGNRDRVLITTTEGELLLIDATGESYKLISRLRVFDGKTEVLSHPALVGTRLFIRDSNEICCLDLQEPTP